MNIPQALAASSAQLLAIRSCRVVMQLAVITITARQFGPAAAGEFALALAMTAPVFVVLDLGLRTLYLSRTPRPGYRELLAVRMATMILALVVCAGLASLRPDMAAVILVVAFNKASELFLELAIGPLQLAGGLKPATILAVVASTTTVTMYLLCSHWGFVPALTAGMVSGAVVLGSCSLLLGTRSAHRVEHHIRPATRAGALIRDGLALGMGNGIISLATSVPQLVLAATFGTAVSGRYAVMLYLVLAGEMVMNAVSQSILPSVADRVAVEGTESLRAWTTRWTKLGTVLAFPAAVIAVFIGALILPPLMGSVYAMTPPEAVLLMVMLVLLPALFVGALALQVRNDYRAIAVMSVATLGVVTVSAFLFVPSFATTGALAAASTGTVTRILLAHRRWSQEALPPPPDTPSGTFAVHFPGDADPGNTR